MAGLREGFLWHPGERKEPGCADIGSPATAKGGGYPQPQPLPCGPASPLPEAPARLSPPGGPPQPRLPTARTPAPTLAPRYSIFLRLSSSSIASAGQAGKGGGGGRRKDLFRRQQTELRGRSRPGRAQHLPAAPAVPMGSAIAAAIFVPKLTLGERERSAQLRVWLGRSFAEKIVFQQRLEKDEVSLRSTLEEQKQRNIHLDELLGQQRQLLNDLQQQTESQRMLYNVQLAEEQGQNLELQVLLESEKVKIQEMKDTLDKERELHSNGGQPQPAFPPEGPLEEKQKHIMELVNESQKYKWVSLRAKQQMEKGRQVQQKTLQVEKEANTLGQQKMEELQSKVEELQCQLQEKRHQVHKLDLEGRRLQGVMQGFQQQELEQKGKEESRRLLYQNVNEGAAWSFTDDRTRNWVLQQKMEGESKDTSYAKLMEMNREKDDSDNEVEIIRQKLQHVATKIQQLQPRKPVTG
ncbi:A-kinase anchor protein 9-like [Cricetulus griseus]|uniref:A-kinase anchor protein 9-like n=1 Tax=Cricetulus griseus TaxID=10029 RepID=A0A9J7J6S4_CRIGR|nr:A-kinase anchor protein 9-like [Cricetulus griseus]